MARSLAYRPLHSSPNISSSIIRRSEKKQNRVVFFVLFVLTKHLFTDAEAKQNMANRGKFLMHNRPANNSRAQNDDDNCSVVCYKDVEDGHVGIVRIRQQPHCSACKLTRSTLSLYYKHILENHHRENVKKLCDENRFLPSVYDQAIHLAFHNDFYYQSDKFHFLYKQINDESSGIEKMETSSTNHGRKRRALQVTLIFQDKSYIRTGTATAQLREQLLKDMVVDRANDIAALPMDMYYIKKKIALDDIHHNAQKSSVILTVAKDQTQVMLKKQHPQIRNGMSPAESGREDNGVIQNTGMMTTQEISTAAENIHDEQPSPDDDVINVCKSILNDLILEIYNKHGELQREQQFLSGIARRSFKKKNTFYCDVCSIFLTSEKYCIQHLNGSGHLENVRNYKTTFLPWRQAMQQALIFGKSMKDIMGTSAYDEYKATMAVYLAPNDLSTRGRFCCAYCELIFTDQWPLEKHLHTTSHKNKKASSIDKDHKELVMRFANIVSLPAIFKLNGITQMSEIPDDIKNRYQWRCINRIQLDQDTNNFIRNYPFDALEGVTRVAIAKPTRKEQKSAVVAAKPSAKPSAGRPSRGAVRTTRIQSGRPAGFHGTRGATAPAAVRFQTTASHRGTSIKRPFPAAAHSSKRFRGEIYTSFPMGHRPPLGGRHFGMDPYGYGRSPVAAAHNNANDRWPSRYELEQQQQQQLQRQEFFERSNRELRSLATDNDGYYGRPQVMGGPNNYDLERPSPNGRSGAYGNPQSNYDPNFIRAVAKAVAEFRPETNPPPPPPPSLVAPSHHHSHRTDTGTTNELIHHVANAIQRTQQQQQLAQVLHQNQSTFAAFGGGGSSATSNSNSAFFPSGNNQHQNQAPAGVDPFASGPAIRSYADYRASSGLAASNPSSSLYSPLANTQSAPSQTRTFDEFGLSALTRGSSQPYGRPTPSSFGGDESGYGSTLGHREQAWRGGGTPRGRGGRGGGHFTPPNNNNKPHGSTFSYSSSSGHNAPSMRGSNFGGGRR